MGIKCPNLFSIPEGSDPILDPQEGTSLERQKSLFAVFPLFSPPYTSGKTLEAASARSRGTHSLGRRRKNDFGEKNMALCRFPLPTEIHNGLPAQQKKPWLNAFPPFLLFVDCWRRRQRRYGEHQKTIAREKFCAKKYVGQQFRPP